MRKYALLVVVLGAFLVLSQGVLGENISRKKVDLGKTDMYNPIYTHGKEKTYPKTPQVKKHVGKYLNITGKLNHKCSWKNPSKNQRTCDVVFEISIADDWDLPMGKGHGNFVPPGLIRKKIKFNSKFNLKLRKILWSDTYSKEKKKWIEWQNQPIFGSNKFAVKTEIKPKIGIENGRYVSNRFNFTFFNNKLDPTVSACAVLDSPDTTYTLDADIINSTIDKCMEITADNVTLDLNEHRIDNNDTNNYGIYAEDVNNITIKDGTVSDWGNKSKICSMTVDYSQIYFNNITDGTVNNLTIDSGPCNGFLADMSSDIEVSNVEAKENLRNIYFYNTSSSRIGNTETYNSSAWDFYIKPFSDKDCNHVLDNVNGTDGKPLSYYNNTVNLRDWNGNSSGIYLCDADNSTLENITLEPENARANAIAVPRSDNVLMEDINVTHMVNLVETGYLNNITVKDSYAKRTDTGYWIGEGTTNSSFINCTSYNATGTEANVGFWFKSAYNNELINSSSYYADYGGYLGNSEQNTLKNFYTTENSNKGIYAHSTSHNLSVLDSTVKNSYYGIQTDDTSSYTYIDNTSVDGSGYSGIFLDGNKNELYNSTVTNSGTFCTLLYTGDNNTMRNNYIGGCNDGLYTYGSSYSLVEDNTFVSNSESGMYIGWYTYNTTFANNTMDSNYWGIYLTEGTQGSEFISNTIKSNSGGVNTFSGGGTLWYNNLFNNSYNINPSISTEMWNTAKQEEENIVGNQYIGGNYWGHPDGTGFSDACVDCNGDGICDLSYSLNSNNTDYLPLAEKNRPATVNWAKLKAYELGDTSNTTLKINATDNLCLINGSFAGTSKDFGGVHNGELELDIPDTLAQDGDIEVYNSFGNLTTFAVNFSLTNSSYEQDFNRQNDVHKQGLKKNDTLANRDDTNNLKYWIDHYGYGNLYTGGTFSGELSTGAESIFYSSWTGDWITEPSNTTIIERVVRNDPVRVKLKENWTVSSTPPVGFSHTNNSYTLPSTIKFVNNVTIDGETHYYYNESSGNVEINSSLVNISGSNVSLSWNETVSSGTTLDPTIIYSEAGITITESVAQQGSANIYDPIPFSREITIENPSETDYSNVLANSTIPHDTLSGSTILYDPEDRQVPHNESPSGGYINWTIDSLKSNETEVWSLDYDIEKPTLKTSNYTVTTDGEKEWWKEMNISANYTTLRDVRTYTHLKDPDRVLYVELYKDGTEITENPDYSFRTVDTNDDGLKDRAEWYIPTVTQQQQNYTVKVDRGKPIKVFDEKVITNKPVKEGKYVDWKWGFKFWNRNNIGIEYLYKARMPLNSFNIYLGDVLKELKYDKYGPYIPIEVYIPSTSNETRYLRYKTDSVNVELRRSPPERFYVNRNATPVINLTVSNIARETVENVEREIPINYGENLELRRGNETVDKEGIVRDEYKLKIENMTGKEELRYSIVYDIPTANGELVSQGVDEGRNKVRLYEVTSISKTPIDDLRYNVDDVDCTQVKRVWSGNRTLEYECAGDPTGETNIVIPNLAVGESMDIWFKYLPKEPVLKPDWGGIIKEAVKQLSRMFLILLILSGIFVGIERAR